MRRGPKARERRPAPLRHFSFASFSLAVFATLREPPLPLPYQTAALAALAASAIFASASFANWGTAASP